MGRTFTGRTEDVDSVFLGAEFWKPNKKISGRVARVFDSQNGPCYVLEPVDGVEIDGEKQDTASIGNLTGFRMALQAAKVDRLLVGDMLSLTCTGLHQTGKGSDRPNFLVEVVRP